ncbi:hypothetical protein C2845_PM07G22770 [Panicum miliaceum]|uniref:Uncharacterized protein n=1 Tax=Panicum miliaceum TaxID=4540 RepID=A0A3L6SJW2_PANMI|nr:hypothetical protein C2845_PM07G22770 [Panicum miliaceum]
MDTSSFNPCSPSSPAPNSSPKERGNGGNPLQRPARQAGSGDAVEEAVPADRAPAPAAEAKKREFPIALSKEIAEDFAVIRGSRANHARTYRRARVTSPAPARLNSSSSIYPRREIEGARRDNEIVCGDVVGLLVMGAHPGVDLTLHLQFSAMSVVVSILGAAWDIFITGSRGATIEAAFKAPRITSKKLIRCRILTLQFVLLVQSFSSCRWPIARK